ncbi:hypothetical protein ACFOD9_13860 [Novosphingobium bradum]|uniref:Uncharacterized protein n=1 Tax=Novosphingobium bradum TaxID=1737444 RepID=A0ABV7IXK0_9SPHN
MNQSDPRRGSSPNAAGTGAGDGWRRRLGELALACAGSFAAEEAQRLHELRRLLAEAPVPALLRGLAVPSEERLDQLIAADAAQSAALAMLGPDCGYLLSRGAGGQHLASVILPGATEEASASGDSFALALVSALGLALIEAEPGPVDRRHPARASRLN